MHQAWSSISVLSQALCAVARAAAGIATVDYRRASPVGVSLCMLDVSYENVASHHFHSDTLRTKQLRCFAVHSLALALLRLSIMKARRKPSIFMYILVGVSNCPCDVLLEIKLSVLAMRPGGHLMHVPSAAQCRNRTKRGRRCQFGSYVCNKDPSHRDARERIESFHMVSNCQVFSPVQIATLWSRLVVLGLDYSVILSLLSIHAHVLLYSVMYNSTFEM